MRKVVRQGKGKRGIWIVMLLCCVMFVLVSCIEKESADLPSVEDYEEHEVGEEKKHLKLGIVTGPYGDMYLETIQPFLAPQGYTVELVMYENYAQPNLALAKSEIDLNMFQHQKYLNHFKFAYNLDLSAITEIPTAAMGIFSKTYGSLEDIQSGATVTVPNDATNLSRALLVLEAAGLIEIDAYMDKSKATIADITHNPKNLRLFKLEAQVLAKSLQVYDVTVINGNFALSAGLALSDALFKETLGENYFNVIAVRTDDLQKQFVQDIIDVVRSDAYLHIITDVDGKYHEFQIPH